MYAYATNCLHGRPIAREHERVHKPAYSQLMGMTAHSMGWAARPRISCE